MALIPSCPVEVFWEETVTCAWLARFGTTVSAAVLTTPASDADIETTVVVVTVPPVTLNVALVDPAATATLPGMRTADGFPAFNTTWDPPLGAAPLRVT